VPEKSAVLIEASSSLHPIHTRTEGLEGFLEVDVHDGAVDGVDAASGALSLRVDRLSSGNRLEDRELQRRIDSRRYPTIDGQMTKLQAMGSEGRYRVTGDLTFRGVTRRCEDEVTITSIDDRTLRLEGGSAFDIRDFGMEAPRIFMLRVHPDVKVRIEVVAEKED
jgi:polyisoprenoid-binding protein YceI